jgi:predicted RNase H-like HicB family nuclease
MLRYRVVVTKDEETGCVVAEVPALGIADQVADVQGALINAKAMVAFHVECLREEGESIPPSEEWDAS